MNCKPGDLAIIISGCYGDKSPNIGKIVKVVEFIGFHKNKYIEANDLWLVDGDVETVNGSKIAFVRDAWLRPVSGLPMEEETQETIKEGV